MEPIPSTACLYSYHQVNASGCNVKNHMAKKHFYLQASKLVNNYQPLLLIQHLQLTLSSEVVDSNYYTQTKPFFCYRTCRILHILAQLKLNESYTVYDFVQVHVHISLPTSQQYLLVTLILYIYTLSKNFIVQCTCMFKVVCIEIMHQC